MLSRNEKFRSIPYSEILHIQGEKIEIDMRVALSSREGVSGEELRQENHKALLALQRGVPENSLGRIKLKITYRYAVYE